MIKTIFFDFDGVIVIPSMTPNLYQKFSRKCGISWDKINKYTLQFWLKARINSIDEEQFWQSFETICKLPKKEVKEIAYSFFHPNTDVLQIIKTLRKQYNVGILSNHLEHWFNHIINTYNLINDFDFIFTSFTERIAKPDLNLYKKVLQTLDVLPEHCIFIDDRKSNLQNATKLGMKTILFQSAAELQEELGIILK